ncbi:PXMP2/4 family protein 4-like protein [Tanacetum coccineum]
MFRRHPNPTGAPLTRPGFKAAAYSRLPERKVFAVPLGGGTKNGVASSYGGFVGWYMDMLKTRPVFTKSVTSGLIYTIADFSSQTITRSSSDSYDAVRTIRMAGYGLIIVGPSLHYWFNFVSRLFPKKDLMSIFKKMFIGQTTFGPLMTVAFFSINAALQGENGSEIISRLKRDLIPTMINGVMYWPLCDFITFRFIPVHLQPLVSNSFAYIWTVYITYMASLEKARPSNTDTSL